MRTHLTQRHAIYSNKGPPPLMQNTLFTHPSLFPPSLIKHAHTSPSSFAQLCNTLLFQSQFQNFPFFFFYSTLSQIPNSLIPALYLRTTTTITNRKKNEIKNKNLIFIIPNINWFLPFPKYPPNYFQFKISDAVSVTPIPL